MESNAWCPRLTAAMILSRRRVSKARPADAQRAARLSQNSRTAWRAFAEFEANLRRERQFEGITRAKAPGAYEGRRPTIQPEAIRALRAEGQGPTEIARALGISLMSVYRALEG